MFWNILKVAFRSIRKEIVYSIIIVLGLTIGIVSSLFLLLYVFDDLSYDRYHENKDRIVRVIAHIKETDDEFTWAVAQIPFAAQVKEDYPEVEEVTRMFPTGRIILTYNEISRYTEEVYYSDSTVFSIFTYHLLQGDPAAVLTKPNTMVVSEGFAKTWFGTENPVGKTMVDGTGRSFEITGMMRDVPENSHVRFGALVSRATLPADEQLGNWGNFGVYTYLLLNEMANYTDLQEKMKEMYDKYMRQIFERYNVQIEYLLEPLTDIYLKSDARGNAEAGGNMSYIYIFSAVSFFMLLIASINYMNLATARSARRAREVGLRKVLGSSRKYLILQFLSESIVLTIIALILSLVIVVALMPSFNQIANKLFDINYLLNPNVILALVGMLLFVGFIGGSYPSLYLSRFSPQAVFKEEGVSGRGGFLVRKILVVIQFSISLVLIISTWIIFKQLHYLQGQELGFQPESVVLIELENREMMRKYPVFREALINHPGIATVSSANNKIGSNTGKILMQVETPEGMQERGVNLYSVDWDFIESMGIQIREGRGFSREFPADTANSVIINETMAKRFNWDKPLGKKVAFIGQDTVMPAMQVVGVVKDFHQLGLYEPVETLLLLLRRNGYYANVKLEGTDVKNTMKFIEDQWKEIFSDRPFEYTFLSEDFSEQYRNDERRGTIFTWFSILIVIIASLGLYGLSAFTVEKRTKEIGIRKVLGASVPVIIRLISREYLILILISMLIAFPAAFFYMKDWLQDYAYPTSIDVWMFLGTGLMAIMITLLTVSYNSIRAGLTNPAQSLRTE